MSFIGFLDENLRVSSQCRLTEREISVLDDAYKEKKKNRNAFSLLQTNVNHYVTGNSSIKTYSRRFQALAKSFCIFDFYCYGITS